MEINSFFKRSEALDSNFNDLYSKIKLLNKHEISKEIDAYYKKFGLDFLNAMILNSILDIDSDKSNGSPNHMISFIEKYSQNLINKLRKKDALSNIIKSWHIWFVAIGSFGYFILELTKFILNHCFNIK
jgi:hypothetical protein